MVEIEVIIILVPVVNTTLNTQSKKKILRIYDIYGSYEFVLEFFTVP